MGGVSMLEESLIRAGARRILDAADDRQIADLLHGIAEEGGTDQAVRELLRQAYRRLLRASGGEMPDPTHPHRVEDPMGEWGLCAACLETPEHEIHRGTDSPGLPRERIRVSR